VDTAPDPETTLGLKPLQAQIGGRDDEKSRKAKSGITIVAGEL